MTFDIIGSGIGGLTTAIALEQKGFKVRIFEQAKKIKTVGAGIIIANNAMQVFAQLGIKKTIEENGNTISKVHITKPNLKKISTMNLSYFEQKFNVKNSAIHRAKLVEILIENLQNTEIHLDHKLSNIEQTNKGYTLNFENGKQIESKQLIGADGLHSKVRQRLFSYNEIRNAKQVCWRGVTNYQLPFETAT